MPKLHDTPTLRAQRIAAYRANAYRMSVPPVYCGNWGEADWCNWVQFNDSSLTGFLPENKALHHAAQPIARGQT